MNFKRPLKAQKIRKITTIVSVFLAIFFTFEFGVKRLTGKIDPLQSNNIINSDEITFDSILNNPSKLISEKIAIDPNIVFNNEQQTLFALESIEIKESPFVDSNTISAFSKRDKVEILGYNDFNNFYKIKYQDKEYYIENKNLFNDINLIFDSVSGEKYTTKDLSIRDYPDPSSGYLDDLNRNDKVTLLGYNHRGYYKIKYNNTEGFIHGDYLSDEKTIGITVPAHFTAYYPADNALEGGFYDAMGNLLDPSKNTCAAPKSIPLGTKIMIIDTGSKYDGMIFTVTDRGGGITINNEVYDIDILMSSNSECNAWGRRNGKIIILD